MTLSLDTILKDHRRQLIKAERQIPSTRGGTSAEAEIVAKQVEDNAASFFEAIRTTDTGYGWCATEDSYDGAPDASGRYSLKGSGATEAEAIEDLKAQITDLEDGPCPSCEYEEGRSEADKQYHEQNCGH